MKLKTFSFIILGLAVVAAVGFFITYSKLFVAGFCIFGAWSVVNFIEVLFKRGSKKPISMVRK